MHGGIRPAVLPLAPSPGRCLQAWEQAPLRTCCLLFCTVASSPSCGPVSWCHLSPAHHSPAREPGRGTVPGVALLGQNTGTLVFLRVLPRDLRSRARSLCIPTWGVTKLTVVTAFFFFFLSSFLLISRVKGAISEKFVSFPQERFAFLLTCGARAEQGHRLSGSRSLCPCTHPPVSSRRNRPPPPPALVAFSCLCPFPAPDLWVCHLFC